MYIRAEGQVIFGDGDKLLLAPGELDAAEASIFVGVYLLPVNAESEGLALVLRRDCVKRIALILRRRTSQSL